MVDRLDTLGRTCATVAMGLEASVRLETLLRQANALHFSHQDGHLRSLCGFGD